MRTLYLLILAIVTIISSAFSQNNLSVDEILNKHIQAHGGQEAWAEVESIITTGTFTGFSIPKPFKTIQKKPNLYRSDYGLSKFNIILSYDGETAWTVDPWFDISLPRELGNSERNVVQQKAEMCSPFLNYKEKGYQVEFLGEEDIEGLKVFKLKLIKNENNSETWYLDAQTFLEFKQESMWDDFGNAVPQETYFDDFRKVEGITIPFYIERSFLIRNRITEIEEVFINQEICDTIFEYPISPEMQK